MNDVSIQKKAYPGGAEYYYIVYIGDDRVGTVHKLWRESPLSGKTKQPQLVGWGGKKETQPVQVFRGCRFMREAVAKLVDLAEAKRDKWLQSITDFGERLLNDGSLEDWEIVISQRLTKHAFCDHRKMQIRLPLLTLTKLTLDEIRDVIRHEVAHAMAGPGEGHGERWKRMCRITGANPDKWQ